MQPIFIEPIIDPEIRNLCAKPYDGHKKGCPSIGKADRCPPKAPMFNHHYDLSFPVYAVINEFDLDAHMFRMAEKHPDWSDKQLRCVLYPDWSDKQLRCVLYWQQTARKQLREKIAAVMEANPALRGYTDTWCPEGMGVNVTETLAAVGITLEWPPKKITRQVAFLGYPFDNLRFDEELS
jgi:predicted metal-binding protein